MTITSITNSYDSKQLPNGKAILRRSFKLRLKTHHSQTSKETIAKVIGKRIEQRTNI